MFHSKITRICFKVNFSTKSYKNHFQRKTIITNNVVKRFFCQFFNFLLISIIIFKNNFLSFTKFLIILIIEEISRKVRKLSRGLKKYH